MKIHEIIVENYKTTRLSLSEGARIAHAEDLVFYEGSVGAIRAVNNLSNLHKNKEEVLSIKWDGRPAIVFGRDDSGQFILTDKGGFTAKGYNGLYTSAKEFVAQKSAKGVDANYLKKITQFWPLAESAVPAGYRGFVLGDIMWFPGELKENSKRFIFTPNTVTYEVDKQSQLGKMIGQSQAGLAVHTFIPSPGAEGIPLKNTAGLNINGPLSILGPEIKNEATVQKDQTRSKQIISFAKKNAKTIDGYLDANLLKEKKMSALPDLLYAFVNAQTKARDLSHLYEKFGSWVQSNPKLSKPMVAKVLEHNKQFDSGLHAIFALFEAITDLKIDILHQLDSHEGTVIAHIAGERGGEGYVSSDEGGPIKLVNRLGFSQANFAGNE